VDWPKETKAETFMSQTEYRGGVAKPRGGEKSVNTFLRGYRRGSGGSWE